MPALRQKPSARLATSRFRWAESCQQVGQRRPRRAAKIRAPLRQPEVFLLWMARAGRNLLGPILDRERKSLFSLVLWYGPAGRTIATDSSGERNGLRKTFYVSDLRINCLLHG